METAQCIMDNLYPSDKRPHGEDGVLVINTKDKSSENMYGHGCPMYVYYYLVNLFIWD